MANDITAIANTKSAARLSTRRRPGDIGKILITNSPTSFEFQICWNFKAKITIRNFRFGFQQPHTILEFRFLKPA